MKIDTPVITTALVIVGLLAVGATVVINAARDYAAAEIPCKAERPGWEPPPIQLCPEDMKLWKCLRDAAYRTDI